MPEYPAFAPVDQWAALSGVSLTAELPGIDPADYPCRLMCRPEHPAEDAQVAIVWQPLPWSHGAVAVLVETLAGGGGILLLARDAGELVRKREAVELLIGPASGTA